MNDSAVLIQDISIKKEINKLARTIIYLELIVFLTSAIILVHYLIKTDFSADINAYMQSNGLIYIISLSAGALCFLHYYKYNHVADLAAVRKKLSLKHILFCAAAMLAIQLVSIIIISLSEAALNIFGYSFITALNNASSLSSSFSMFLYISLIAPLIEEFVFRGIILTRLLRYGKVFAIVASSVSFGLYHGNFYQAILATFLGMLLGYIATEYSLKYSVLLHIINNMILAELLGLLNNINAALSTSVHIILYIISVVVVITAYAKNDNKFFGYLKENRPLINTYKYMFTSLFFIAFVILNIFISILGIEKL